MNPCGQLQLIWARSEPSGPVQSVWAQPVILRSDPPMFAVDYSYQN